MTPSSPTSPAAAPGLPEATDAPRWLRWGFRLLALGLGALHTLIAVRSQSMNEDGIQYLDLGDAWWQGDWGSAINTTWSPLYAWIVGGTVNLVRPSIWWEFPAVQVTNLVLYAVALVCFEHFWRQLTRTYYTERPGEPGTARFPSAIWLALGYSLFIYVSLNLVQVWAVTPDMCVAALVYLAAGQLLRLDGDRSTAVAAVIFGLLLGLGFLAKSAMFPLGLAGIVLYASLRSSRPGRLARLALASAAFLLVAGPWVAAISNSVGHLAFSDVGRFAYLKHVNQMPWPNWQEAEHRIDGAPLHPPRLVHEHPPVWEFAEPVGGTYAPGYDPAWWTRGLEPRVEAGTQRAAIAGNLAYYFDLFVRMQGGFLAVLALLLATSHRSWREWRRFDGPAALVLWSLAALGLYALVYAEARYVAPFVLLLWAGLLAKVRLPDAPAGSRVATAGGALSILLVWINIGSLNLEGLAGMVGYSPTHEMAAGAARGRSLSDGQAVSHPRIAAELRALGLRRGDRVAFVGHTYGAYWARLARVRIVAEVRADDAGRFWSTDDAGRTTVLAAITASGARVVVAEPQFPTQAIAGWQPLGGTGYLLHWLE